VLLQDTMAVNTGASSFASKCWSP